ncbi:hypothetical protein D9M69_377430 [compost metagenome]
MHHLGQGQLAEHGQQRGVQLPGSGTCVHQQAGLRVVTEQRGRPLQPIDAAEQCREQFVHPAQPVQCYAFMHLHQEQPALVGRKRQVEGLSMADGGAAQAPGQPAVEPAQLLQRQASLLRQARGETLVAGLQRIALPRRQLLATAFMAVDARTGLPAQVIGLAHFRTTAQRPAQGIGAGRQGHVLALQAQPGVESNRGLGHGGSGGWGWASIYCLVVG